MKQRLLTWLLSYLEPSELQNLNLDELAGAMTDLRVRKRWLWAVLEEIKECNRRVHVAMMNGNLEPNFVKESARLQGIDWTLRQILIAKNSVSMDKDHNLDLDEPSVAVQPI
jgi:hypothetical protein